MVARSYSSIVQILFLFSVLDVVFFVSGTSPLNHATPPKPVDALKVYWTNKIQSNVSSILISRASPLTAVESARFADLAANNSLQLHSVEFCLAAKLFCFPGLTQFAPGPMRSSFNTYTNKNFTSYGSAKDHHNSFTNYSNGENVIADTFRGFGKKSSGRNDFSTYATDGNVVGDRFNTYNTDGEFSSFAINSNVIDSGFTSYGSDVNSVNQSFTGFGTNSNTGEESFSSYGKHSAATIHGFSSYADSANVLRSSFSAYGESSTNADDKFNSYAIESNAAGNTFRSYDELAQSGSKSFNSYSDQANVGDDSFQSYGKNAHGENDTFTNYGKSFNGGSSSFNGYGKGATNLTTDFKSYAKNTTFKSYYSNNGTNFASYSNKSSAPPPNGNNTAMNRWVEPGKFFRESLLKNGTVMVMPDIRDKLPERSFLPRTLLSKLPFSSDKILDITKTFGSGENSSMENIIRNAINECERPPSRGETKHCVGSGEDMIDFAVGVLGGNITLRSTENTSGSKQNITIGSVRPIHNGSVTRSVSCHQSLYPYLLYYCHSVPRVRVYEADILATKQNKKINHGVAICHLDTSAWSPTHGAFLALGSAPGQIEVCHWIFQNDWIWTLAD